LTWLKIILNYKNEHESKIITFLVRIVSKINSKEKKRKKKAILLEVMMNENGRKND
jgi:hypothetical protein